MRCVCRQYVCDMLVCSQCVCVCVRLLDFAFFNNSIFEGMKSFSFFCILRLNPYIKDQCICGSAYMCVFFVWCIFRPSKKGSKIFREIMTKTNKMKRLVLIIVIWLIDMLRWLVSVFSTEIIALASSLKAYVFIIYSSKKKISEAIGAFLEQMIIAELFRNYVL